MDAVCFLQVHDTHPPALWGEIDFYKENVDFFNDVLINDDLGLLPRKSDSVFPHKCWSLGISSPPELLRFSNPPRPRPHAELVPGARARGHSQEAKQAARHRIVELTFERKHSNYTKCFQWKNLKPCNAWYIMIRCLIHVDSFLFDHLQYPTVQ